jgi:hypothetical protein
LAEARTRLSVAGEPTPTPGPTAAPAADTVGVLADSLAEGLAVAAATGPLETADLLAGGQRVRLSFAGDGVADVIRPAIEHILAPTEREADAEIGFWDCRLAQPSLGAFDEIPSTGEQQQHLMMVRPSDGSVVMLEHGSGAVTLVDAAGRRGYHAFAGPESLLWWERASPARLLLHTLLASETSWMLHAGAVAAPGGPAALMVGRGGSGKSTLSLACLMHGLDYLGDDYVLADTGDGEPWVHSLYATAKVTENTLRLVPGMEGTSVAAGDGERGFKHVLDMAAHRPAQIRTESPLAAIVVPRITGGKGARLERVPGARAVLALAPSTTFQMPDRNGGALHLAAALARRVPAYVLELGDDPADGAKLVGEMLERHG